MNGPPWSQAPVPEESWATAHNPEHSTFVQSSNTWQPTPLTTQELQTLDSSSWYSVSQAPVDTGLSPVLSHESQSTHTLNCISEPELLPLPPGLDLSFIGEPTWDHAGSVCTILHLIQGGQLLTLFCPQGGQFYHVPKDLPLQRLTRSLVRGWHKFRVLAVQMLLRVYAYGFVHTQQMPTSMPGPRVMKSAEAFKCPMPTQSPCSAASMTSESEEGRHRNDPLYSRGPESDGLYHCPFESDPNCQHKPTKLKCNYDKFIDSHLKPFRCKIEACSKQEFSSTACLLRHEREAHGMHGHGDRPHLCYYGGCERGIPGNGFPRRYNLFDHMKRVHDHKDEPTQDRGSPEGRKTSGRKRKASGSVSEESPAQRPKIQRIPTPVSEPSPVMAVPQATCVATDASYPEDYRAIQNRQQRAAYSQWANQRQLLEFSVTSVNGPQDEVNLQRLSQNVEELRRLSQQARHG
ncbi:uncharacterized protein MYCFIDRAFT_212839 [Pseudocercospora fijiensis CIRAD86]|uniref:C2H2-type domain-containing protein n=1 Tax=Pseudocercospora fijiensis (strain CIRAD86) TaxID=383855 RepID=N1Q5T0_PSEFD|nr:uncharacterized protein MYCFIDRAFT_212839 [Pseudocercospora fijiensis CIRAD86]EME87329.1 hypothetical protein MYCFIDRAFT_212839 [Pseudocercospora fijiensis CIRAD86]